MNKFLLITISLIFYQTCFAQDQSINGTLRVTPNLILKNDLPNSVNFEQYGGRLTFGEGANANGDNIFIARYNVKNDHSELRFVLGNDGTEKIAIGYSYFGDSKWKEKIVLQANGRIGIGVSEPTCALDANGTIRAKEVKIEATGWADFVFSEDYKLPSLSEVENHIKENKHLPDIPSEKEVKENGISVGEMQAKLLQKIEELTLYTIQLEKKYDKLKDDKESLERRINELENK